MIQLLAYSYVHYAIYFVYGHAYAYASNEYIWKLAAQALTMCATIHSAKPMHSSLYGRLYALVRIDVLSLNKHTHTPKIRNLQFK